MLIFVGHGQKVYSKIAKYESIVINRAVTTEPLKFNIFINILLKN